MMDSQQGADSIVSAAASLGVDAGVLVPIAQLPGALRFRNTLTSAVLATDIGAELLVILTAVPQVYLGYGTPEQQSLGAVTLEEIEHLQGEGHFPAGSMGPKVEAVVRFLKAGGRRALITNPESLPLAIDGRAGTHFIGKL